MLVPFSACGSVVSLSFVTRLAVAVSDGAVVAIALKNAVVPALSSTTGETAATPDTSLTSFWSVVSRESDVDCAGEPNLTATRSGPLTPSPKLSAIWSYAWRAVVEVESAPMSCWPRFSDRTGLIRGSRIASASSPATNGGEQLSWAHLAHRPPCDGCDSGWRSRTRNEFMCGPMIANTAGSSG